MSKSPAQKAYEAWCGEHLNGAHEPWAAVPDYVQMRWVRAAAAVTAPEPKSYGEVCFEAMTVAGNGRACDADISEGKCECWNDAALAVIAEFKRREGLDP